MIITLFLMGKFPFFQENRMLFLFCQRVQFETENNTANIVLFLTNQITDIIYVSDNWRYL